LSGDGDVPQFSEILLILASSVWEKMWGHFPQSARREGKKLHQNQKKALKICLWRMEGDDKLITIILLLDQIFFMLVLYIG
jgi:hypothetical protein